MTKSYTIVIMTSGQILFSKNIFFFVVHKILAHCTTDGIFDVNDIW